MSQQSSPAIPSSPDSYDKSSVSSPSDLQCGGSLTSATSSMAALNVCNQTASVDGSHTSLAVDAGSMLSQKNLQSQEKLESQKSFLSHDTSITSQASLQSQLSFLSQSSLGFLPSLDQSLLPSEGTLNGGTVDHGCAVTLKGQDGQVFSLAIVGEHLYSGSDCRHIRVCMKADLTKSCSFGSGEGAVKALVVARDRIFSAHQDHKIRVWKRPDEQQPGRALHKLKATMPTVKDYMLTFIHPKGYVQTRRHHKNLWIQHVDTISVLAAGPNNLLYSGSWDRTVKVWKLPDLKCLESFKAHDDAINALVISGDGFVYTASADAKIRVWTKQLAERKHSLVRTIDCHKSAVNALALSPDGSVLYSGACDRSIVVWEREDSAQHVCVAGALRGHRHAILCLASVRNTLCSGSADKTIRVWRREAGMLHSCVAVLRGHGGPVKCLIATMHNTMNCLVVYSGSLDQDIKKWWVCGSKNDEDKSVDVEESNNSGLHIKGEHDHMQETSSNFLCN